MSNSAKVYLTQLPLKSGINGLEPSFDLNPLREFGEIITIFEFRELFDKHSFKQALRKLEMFDPDVDSIMPVGSPMSMLITGAALNELGLDEIAMVAYDKRAKRNYLMPVIISDNTFNVDQWK